jgi:hypothetical protein
VTTSPTRSGYDSTPCKAVFSIVYQCSVYLDSVGILSVGKCIGFPPFFQFYSEGNRNETFCFFSCFRSKILGVTKITFWYREKDPDCASI